MAKASKPKTVGRPKKQIDIRQVQRLACVALSPAQIATILDANEKTIERNFGTVIKKSREKLCHQLRYKIYERAMAGDTACLIFAGKVLAGLKEPREDAVNVHVNTAVVQNNNTPELRKQFLAIDEALRKEAVEPNLIPNGNGHTEAGQARS